MATKNKVTKKRTAKKKDEEAPPDEFKVRVGKAVEQKGTPDWSVNGSCSAAKWRQCRRDINWIFRNHGASDRYVTARIYGASRLGAAYTAQRDNPVAQRRIINCYSLSVKYLDSE